MLHFLYKISLNDLQINCLTFRNIKPPHSQVSRCLSLQGRRLAVQGHDLIVYIPLETLPTVPFCLILSPAPCVWPALGSVAHPPSLVPTIVRTTTHLLWLFQHWNNNCVFQEPLTATEIMLSAYFTSQAWHEAWQGVGEMPSLPLDPVCFGISHSLSLEKSGWSESYVEHLLLNSTEHVFKHKKKGLFCAPFPFLLILLFWFYMFTCSPAPSTALALALASNDVLGASFPWKAARFFLVAKPWCRRAFDILPL